MAIIYIAFGLLTFAALLYRNFYVLKLGEEDGGAAVFSALLDAAIWPMTLGMSLLSFLS